ncbi:hypothetical protein H5410_062500 [Solanum commersonii]|uniref:Uncharacterized protein n=1 Tax=Solanum commersonii TaxID=4109 RepID=A0A9J5WCU7_SOLCO|nr:hypothetical protein H5410_062500 [Solanum commersonii]
MEYKMFDIHMARHFIFALVYWLLRPLSWDIWWLCFFVRSFLINELIELSGNTITLTFILGIHKFYCYISETRNMDNLNKHSHDK